MDLGIYILNILKKDIRIVLCWGFNSATRTENGIQFKVNGFKHKGIVQIKYNEGTDLFDITLINRRKRIVREIKNVYCDTLVETIDYHIEKVDNYKERVIKEYTIKEL